METIVNASLASPLANYNLKVPIAQNDTGLLGAFYNRFNGWTALLTLLIALVAYDQCLSGPQLM